MKEFKHITKHEFRLIGEACCDIETGNHLLFKRSQDHIDMIREIFAAKQTKNPDARQKEIIEAVRILTDYDYAKDNDVLFNDHIKWKDS